MALDAVEQLDAGTTLMLLHFSPVPLSSISVVPPCSCQQAGLPVLCEELFSPTSPKLPLYPAVPVPASC